MKRLGLLCLATGLRGVPGLQPAGRFVSSDAAVFANQTASGSEGQEATLAEANVKKPAVVALADTLIAQITVSSSHGEAAEKEAPSALVNKFVAFMHQESREVAQSKRRLAVAGGRRKAERTSAATLLTATQRLQLLSRLCDIVEKRQVSLVVASRLVKRPWSPSMSTDNYRDAQHFIHESLKAWIVDDIKQDALSPSDARAILANGAVLLRHGDVSVVGSLAQIATRDAEDVYVPDALISLMWSVHTSGAHAPREFWGYLLNRLLFLNGHLQGGMAGVLEADRPTVLHPSAAAGQKSRSRPEVGHVFSGLTTRQVYRLLAVLKREKWNADMGALRNLADQALKNIVFEAEAASFVTSAEDVSGSSPLSKSAVERRMKAVADLNMEEFVDLLAISGDFGIPFSVSAARVSEHILTPMVRYLDSLQLLQVMQIARQTRCNSAALMNVLAAKIEQRGPHAPYALPLSKAFTKTLLKETDLFPQVNLVGFLSFFLRVCDEQAGKVRGEELCGLCDTLYTLSRRFAPTSTVGLKIRHTVDLFCRQMNRMLQLEVVKAGLSARLLEYTIVLGMRNDPDVYQNVASLLETRNAAVERERARMRRISDNIAEDTARPSGVQLLHRRWEDQDEDELPKIPKAAFTVYSELIYMFERMAVVKASLSGQDFRRFDEAFERAGLYNIFLGARLMKLAHLEDAPATTDPNSPVVVDPPAAAAIVGAPPQLDALPGWMEKRVHHLVVRKIRDARLSPSATDDQVLRVLGHLHCDAEKVHYFIELIQSSPFRVLREQRDLWGYVCELAGRFGGLEDQQLAAERYKKALF